MLLNAAVYEVTASTCVLVYASSKLRKSLLVLGSAWNDVIAPSMVVECVVKSVRPSVCAEVYSVDVVTSASVDVVWKTVCSVATSTLFVT